MIQANGLVMLGNNLCVFGDYMLWPNGRGISSVTGGVVTFNDASWADLSTGDFLDLKAGTEKAFSLCKLAPGMNEFSFGSLNEAPEEKLFQAKSVELKYPGNVMVHTWDKPEILVLENQYCQAIARPDGVFVKSLPRVSIKIERGHKAGTHIESSSIEEEPDLPTLHIYAPADARLSGDLYDLQFESLKAIDVDASSVVGVEAEKINIDMTADVSVSVATVGSLIVNTAGEVSVLGPMVVSGLLDITTPDSVTIKALKCPVIKLDLDGKLIIKNVETNDITISSSDDVEIKSSIIAKLDAKVDGSISVKGSEVAEVKIVSEDDVTLDLNTSNSITVEASGETDIKVATGTTVIVVRSDDEVALSLPVAKSVFVRSCDDVTVRAVQYLAMPDISADGDVDVK